MDVDTSSHRSARAGWSADDELTGRRPRRSGLTARLDDATVAVAVRTGVSPRAVVGLVLVALLVTGVLGARVLLTRAHSGSAPLAPSAPTGPATGGLVSAAAASPAAPTAPPTATA